MKKIAQLDLIEGAGGIPVAVTDYNGGRVCVSLVDFLRIYQAQLWGAEEKNTIEDLIEFLEKERAE